VTPVLIDTNVISELARARPDARVVAFVQGVRTPLLSSVTLHELTYGAERVADPERREHLLTWIGTVRARFRGRIVDVDADVAEVAGLLRAGAEARGRVTDVIDALIAASALVRGAVIATRNVGDFVPLGVEVLDPWEH
jgi:toxin FitB